MATWIALRYLVARGSPLTYVSRLALLGLILSVAVLVIVLSIVNGFERELRERVLGMLPHVTAYGYGGLTDDELHQLGHDEVLASYGLAGLAPFVAGTVLIAADQAGKDADAELRIESAGMTGIEPATYRRVNDVEKHLAGGDLDVLNGSKYGVIVGASLATKLAVEVGDSVRLILPIGSVSPAGVVPRQRRFTVLDTFDSQSQLDSQSVFVLIDTAAKLMRTGDRVHGVEGRLLDLFDSTAARAYLTDTFGASRVRVRTWMGSGHGSLYQAIGVQKLTMFVLLSFLVAVAAFNLVSGLMMIVEQRRTDVAILRTLGCNTRTLLTVFMTLGVVLALCGICIGLATGVVVASQLPSLFAWASSELSLELMTQYFIAYLPVDVRSGDLLGIAGAASALALIATLYPAWRATRLAPSVVLAHE